MCVARWMGQIWLFGWMHVGGETGNGGGCIKDRRLGRERGRVFCVSGAPIRFPVFGSKCAFRCLCVLPHNTSTRNCIGCFAASLSFFRESEIFINFPPTHPTHSTPHILSQPSSPHAHGITIGAFFSALLPLPLPFSRPKIFGGSLPPLHRADLL